MSNLEQENEILKLKLQKLEALELKRRKAEEARVTYPWRYMHKRYPWQQEVIDSTNRRQILVAANQVGKSSTAIMKVLEWALNQELWPVVFPDSYKLQKRPRGIWYLYPSLKTATMEFQEKWVPLMPPPDHPELGWEVKNRGRDVDTLNFKNGVTIRFKTYMQDVHALQAGSCDMIICDEEVPVDVLPELQMRVQATNGYMVFAFTATRGQSFWRRVVEERKEWTDAEVWQVSLYDCQKFIDGSDSHWSTKRIQNAIQNCISDAQVQRRIFGRFVRDEGLMYEVFNRKKNVIEYDVLSPEWSYYVGVDYGSGGAKGHPSSVAICAVNSTYTKARVVGLWRGDKISTTAEDVVNKVVEMTSYLDEDKVVWIRYDYSAADIGTIANRRGIGKIDKADKGRDTGVATLQSLIKNGALQICEYNDKARRAGINDANMQTYKLIEEFENLGVDDKKTVAEDDAIDAVRYALNGVAFDWEAIGAVKVKLVEKPKPTEEEIRRGTRGYFDEIYGDTDIVEEEIGFWNEQMD